MKTITQTLFALAILVIAVTACKKKDTDQALVDKGIIQKYIKDNALNADSTADGLYYVIADSGIGPNPTVYSIVNVYYKGYLTNNTIFEQTTPGLPREFALQGTIKGWQEGVPFIKKGGKIKLLIPSALGYGATATGSISANSVLIYDIELSNFR